ncbi:MAG: IPTL-CTERM sorting domain-containing protein [Acidovorax sp.]|nr:IPTL-CTERM sorting domain-containing protein [Acidovorax sp.]
MPTPSRLPHTCHWKPACAAALIALSGASLAADNSSIPTLDCNTKPSVFNTGYNGAAPAQIAPGQTDPQWFVSSTQAAYTPSTLPPSNASSTWGAAFVPNTISVAWAPSHGPSAVFVDAQNRPNAEWLSPRAVGTNHDRGPGGTAYAWPYPKPYTNFYRTQFYLAPGIAPTNVAIALRYYNDDGMRGVFVNGVRQTIPWGGFWTSAMQTATLAGPWQTGLNTIVFAVQDVGWIAGFMAQAIPTATSICKVLPPRPSAVPALQFTALLGLSGLLGFLGFWRTRRRQG